MPVHGGRPPLTSSATLTRGVHHGPKVIAPGTQGASGGLTRGEVKHFTPVW